MPILSSLYGQGRTGEAATFLRANLALSGGISLLIAIPLMLLSRYIMRAYGESFESGWLVLVVILGAYSIAAVTLVFRDVISSSGKMWIQVIHSVIWGIILIVVAILLSGHGALGLALAYLIAYPVFFAVQFAYVFSGRFLPGPNVENPVGRMKAK
jgi:O-antigen/teichoic acid export membrane protein